MKPFFALLAVLAAAPSAYSQEIIKASPDGAANTSIYAQNRNQPGFNSSKQGMELYWEGDKEHVFTISPASIMDASTQNTGANYQGQLSYNQEKSMGVQLGIPAFGSPEKELAGKKSSDSGMRRDFPPR